MQEILTEHALCISENILIFTPALTGWIASADITAGVAETQDDAIA